MMPQSGTDTHLPIVPLANMRERTRQFLRGAGLWTAGALKLPGKTARIPAAFIPLTKMLAQEEHINGEDFSNEVDKVFEALYAHPLTEQTRKATNFLRKQNILPNEVTTESLIRYVIHQSVARSPVPVPQQIIDEFWTFFHELMSEPELRGLADLNLDIVRLLLKTYEPLLVEVINELKDIFYSNQRRVDQLSRRVQVVRRDLDIIRRQIKALRYIKPFFQADPKDYHTQAEIVASMVREFGPFFIKMAQVAAANADFLPDEIAKELTVFQEDVPPMSAEEARQALFDSFGQEPEAIYFGFDADRPLKSGSIGSVYLAKKPVMIDGREQLRPVVIKIGRHNLDREFVMGKTSIGLMLLSSQYWAPHSKLTPFLKAMMEQIDEFVDGFRAELQFEREAGTQEAFARRAQNSKVWHVPQVYASTERIIEMEYVQGAVNVSRAVDHFKPRDRIGYKRELARKFLFTILTHIFVYQEIHGDLHPGNVMVDKEGRLHLIDWGNTISLQGLVAPLWEYALGAIIADPEMLTESLISLCTDPASALQRKDEIRETLARTLEKKEVKPLSYDFALELYLEGPEGWLKRANTMLHLMSNTQHLGIVVRGEYLHLSRSIVAMIGTLGHLYDGVPRYQMLYDIMMEINTFPARFLQDFLSAKQSDIRQALFTLARRLVFAAAPEEKLH